VKATVLHPNELGSSEVSQWQELQRHQPALANPFLSAEFALAVGRVREDARVAVLEDGSEVLGFFAFQCAPLGLGRPIGAGIADCQGLVWAPGAPLPEPSALLEASGLAVWEFDDLLGFQAAELGAHAIPERSPIVDVSGGHTAYLERRGDFPGRSSRYKARRLEREHGALRFEFDARETEALELLVRWKSAQYLSMGGYDRFARPWIAGLVRDLFANRPAGCAGVLSMLWAGNTPVAANFGLRSESILASWFPTYDAAFSRHSPGRLLFLHLLEAAAAEGLNEVNLGKGSESYKQWLKTGDLAIAEGWLQRPSIRALARSLQRRARRHLRRHVTIRPHLRRGVRRIRGSSAG
jgi:CelD/BcsL family acetyltransferase involved in cellulose biosynthesis